LRVIKKREDALPREPAPVAEREFFIDNLLVRNHFIIVMIRWTGLAPWECDPPALARCLRDLRQSQIHS